MTHIGIKISGWLKKKPLRRGAFRYFVLLGEFGLGLPVAGAGLLPD
jgi:hypothetical protein